MQQHALNTWLCVCARVCILCVFSTFGYFTILLKQLQPVFKTLENGVGFFSDSVIRHCM